MVHLYEEKQKKNIKDNKIGMGIALRHFDIACNKFGLEVDYSKIDVKKRMASHFKAQIFYYCYYRFGTCTSNL